MTQSVCMRIKGKNLSVIISQAFAVCGNNVMSHHHFNKRNDSPTGYRPQLVLHDIQQGLGGSHGGNRWEQ